DHVQRDASGVLAKYRAQLGMLSRLAPSVLHDVMLSNPDAKVEGEAGGPWRLTGELFGQQVGGYAGLVGGQVKALGAPDAPVGVGQYALERLAAKDVARARQAMDWVVADAAALPTGPMLKELWGGAYPQDDKTLAVAAAMMSASRDPRAIPILVACDSSAPNL